LTKFIEVAGSFLRARNATPLALMRRQIQRLALLIAPIRFALGKSRMKAVFGVEPAELRPAAFRFRPSCQSPDCAAHVEAVASQSRICRRADRPGRWARLWTPTPLILDLGRFANFDAYRNAVSKITGGRYRRSANKAARLGYVVRRIDERAYAASVHRICASKTWRSHGPVLEALFGDRAVRHDADIAPAEPACHEHWTRAWGVFGPLGGREALVARALLRRAGNVLAFDFFMGQAELLKEGVTKALMFEIMKWVLDRKDPAALGLEFAFQGVVEIGGRGVIDWKRYTLFEPRSLVLKDDRPFELPEGFDPAVYLDLNPDVGAAGVDPVRHFIFHGLHEGRPYRRPAP
jgi:hypothetical protein